MKKTKRLTLFTILVVFISALLLTVVVDLEGLKVKAEDPTFSENDVSAYAKNGYTDYIDENKAEHIKKYGNQTFTPDSNYRINAFDYYGLGTTLEQVKVVDKTSHSSYNEAVNDQLLIHEDQGMVTWKVEVAAAGFYNISMRYYTIEGYSSSIERGFAINGKIPFSGANALTFSRIWYDDPASYDAEGNLKKDINGNELKPKQIEKREFREVQFTDYMGYISEPYMFYFEEGVNYISLIAIKEPIMIDYIDILPVVNQKNYQEYLAEMISLHGSAVLSDKSYRVEAENSYEKSSPTLYPITDRSSSNTYPFSHTKTLLNTIGGSNWVVLGEWISWQIVVPESGYYNISMRAKQNINRGMYSSRKVSIDNEILFNELNDVKFPYSNKWQNYTLGNDDGDFLFYFEKGTHTITMEVTLGEYAPLIERIQTCVDALNAIYRQVISYTTVSPDTGRDYELNKKFPTLLEEFTYYADELDAISKEIQKISGGESDKTGVIDSVVVQLRSIIKDNLRTFPSRLNAYNTNVSSLGTILNDLRELPLQIDYIQVHTTDVELPKANENFFRKIWNGIVSFVTSFFIDYSAIGETVGGNEGDRIIEVWMTQGRDQANVIRNLIDTDFKKKYPNIRVELKLTASDVLLKSTLAGIGPNVALNVDSTLPVNYALRNAVLDLTPFIYETDANGAIKLDSNGKYIIKDENFYMLSKNEEYTQAIANNQSLTNVYYESSISQFQFYFDSGDSRNGTTGTYALPEKQIFLMMFVRDDIMEELGLTDMIPETWDEMLNLVAELQTRQSQFYLPVNDTSSTSALNPIFTSMLYQNGGSLYTNNNKECGLLSEAAMSTFEYWTELYTLYSFPKYASFVNRFRSGQMPIGISYYEMYNTLSVFAPELKGKWSYHLIPGVAMPNEFGDLYDENGKALNVDHTAVASGTGAVILKGPADKDPQAKTDSWEFLKWWSSAETQTSFGREMEGILGSAARHATANVKALNSLAWPKDDLNILMKQWSQTCSIPQVAGSYMTGREVENAYRQVINNYYNPREVLYEYANKINIEIDRKRDEFKLTLRNK